MTSSGSMLRLALAGLLLVGCGGGGHDTTGFGDTGGKSGGSTGGKSGSTGGKGGSQEGGAGGDMGGAGGGDTGGAGGSGPVNFTMSDPQKPFGMHAFKYPAGVLKPTGTQQALDAAVTAYYDKWKAKYLQPRCGGYVVLTEGGTGAADGTFTVSEGHGYGMVITALMAGHDPDAQKLFNGLYSVFRSFPSFNDDNLMDWQILNQCPKNMSCKEPVQGCFRIDGSDSGSATDGDMDIAFALLLADKQWGSNGAYLAEARKVIASVKAKEMNAKTKYPLLADDIADGDPMFYTTRPSDFMLDHFRAFGKATSDAFWMQSVDAIEGLLTNLQKGYAPMTGLIPDFVVDTDKPMPKPAPPKWPADEGITTAEYAYNSCRVPWRIGTDFIVSGDTRSRDVLKAMNTWIKMFTGGKPQNIIDGFTLSGELSGASSGYDLSFAAPFAVSAIADTDQAWLDGIWSDIGKRDLSSYFGDSIKMISMIVVSQNWWAPQ
jgi:endo-1,4-beta-D-glucanase Y